MSIDKFSSELSFLFLLGVQQEVVQSQYNNKVSNSFVPGGVGRRKWAGQDKWARKWGRWREGWVAPIYWKGTRKVSERERERDFWILTFLSLLCRRYVWYTIWRGKEGAETTGDKIDRLVCQRNREGEEERSLFGTPDYIPRAKYKKVESLKKCVMKLTSQGPEASNWFYTVLHTVQYRYMCTYAAQSSVSRYM